MAQKESESGSGLAESLKKSIRARDNIYRLNVAHPSAEVGKVAATWAEHGIATIADWGLTKRYNVELFTESNIPITEDVVGEQFQAEFSAELLDWDALRDTLAEEAYGDKENPKRHAGQAKGSIRRFVSEYDTGTVILANFPEGQVPGIVASECYYRPDNPAIEYADDHVFVREVEWARDENGEPLTIPDEALPDAFQPRRQSTTRVKNPQQLIDVARLMEVLME